MAEEGEKSQPRKGELNKSNKKKPMDGPYRFPMAALANIGVFATLSYVLGRLRTEAYYNALGMAPGALSFGPEHYMFSSVNLVIICGIVTFFLHRYYIAVVRGERMFLAFPLYPDPKNKGEKMIDISMIVFLLAFTVYTLLALYSGKGLVVYAAGALGVTVGIAIGIAAILLISFIRWLVGPRQPYTIFLVGALLIIGWLPSISANLAKMEAKTDMQTFPKAILICENALSLQLQDSPRSPQKSTEVRVITTNNDMTYVLKQDVDADDEWQVYGIQNSNIETIIFAEKSG